MIHDHGMRLKLAGAVVQGMRLYARRAPSKTPTPDVVDVVVDQLMPVVCSIAADIDHQHRANLQNLEATVRDYAASAVLPDGRLAYERVALLLADLRKANRPVSPVTATQPRKD